MTERRPVDPNCTDRHCPEWDNYCNGLGGAAQNDCNGFPELFFHHSLIGSSSGQPDCLFDFLCFEVRTECVEPSQTFPHISLRHLSSSANFPLEEFRAITHGLSAHLNWLVLQRIPQIFTYIIAIITSNKLQIELENNLALKRRYYEWKFMSAHKSPSIESQRLFCAKISGITLPICCCAVSQSQRRGSQLPPERL